MWFLVHFNCTSFSHITFQHAQKCQKLHDSWLCWKVMWEKPVQFILFYVRWNSVCFYMCHCHWRWKCGKSRDFPLQENGESEGLIWRQKIKTKHESCHLTICIHRRLPSCLPSRNGMQWGACAWQGGAGAGISGWRRHSSPSLVQKGKQTLHYMPRTVLPVLVPYWVWIYMTTPSSLTIHAFWT